MKTLTHFVTVIAFVLALTVPTSAQDPSGNNSKLENKRTPEQLLSLSKPYSSKELRSLAAKPSRTDSENNQLMRLILLAAAKRDASIQYLLKDPELPKDRDIELALAGYDYMLNQSKESLDKVLAQLATEGMGADANAIVILGVVDEWDRTIRAFKKHFFHTDGAGASAMHYFLEMRSLLYPKEYQKMQKQFSISRLNKPYRAYLTKPAEQDGAGQPATAPQSKSQSNKNIKQESKGRSQ